MTRGVMIVFDHTPAKSETSEWFIEHYPPAYDVRAWPHWVRCWAYRLLDPKTRVWPTRAQPPIGKKAF